MAAWYSNTRESLALILPRVEARSCKDVGDQAKLRGRDSPQGANTKAGRLVGGQEILGVDFGPKKTGG